MRDSIRNAGSLALWLAMVTGAACQPQNAAIQDAGPPTAESESSPPSAPSDTASAAREAGEHAAHWEGALTRAMRLACRAIAVDGAVRVDAEGDAGADAGADHLAHNDDIPEGVWLSPGQDARLVAKDPRTTRETTFLGPARARPCVGHREESWIAAGAFESTMGAGETPGAEEWIVTPLSVVRYMAAKLRVDVRAAETVVSVGSGDAFLWLSDDVRQSGTAQGRDAGESSAKVDDDGWYRLTGGAVRLTAVAQRTPPAAARVAVDRCGALTKQSRDLALRLLSGAAEGDGGAAKEQLKTRRLARAACAVAAMKVAALTPSPSRDALSATLNAGSLDR